MANPQKNKGKRFERDVAKFLTETFNKNFMRVPNSGAFTGGKNQHRVQAMSGAQVKIHRGDIIAPDEFNFIVECKNHRAFSTGFAGILLGNNKVLDGWLSEVYTDAEQGKIPHALAFKITGSNANIFFALPKEQFGQILDTKMSYAIYYHKASGKDYIIVPSSVFKARYEAIAQVIGI